MDHRRTPTGKAYVPASWFIVLTILLCVGAAGWLGWLFVDDDPETAPTSSTSAPPSATTTPTPSPSKTTETTPTPSPSKTTEEPEADRTTPVAVLNNTTIQGLAATYSAKVRSAGWTTVSIGNWRGSIAGNTVYFPPQLEEQAKLLADDLGIGRVLPSVAPMRTDRLTIILSGPQQ